MKRKKQIKFLLLLFCIINGSFYYTRLFLCYARERIAEKLGVVEADVGYHAEFGSDDIGAVESAAESHLYHGEVNTLVAEIAESHGSGQFEERRSHLFKPLPTLLHEIHHIAFGYAFPVDANAFAKIDEVWRSVQADLISVVLKQCSERVRHCSLAVCASHMNGFERLVWMLY